MSTLLSEAIAKEVVSDEYFNSLLEVAEKAVADKVLRAEVSEITSEHELGDLLRFADLLSHSNRPENRNLAYYLLSLLYELHDFTDEEAIYAEAVLSKIGNFPALDFLNAARRSTISLPIEREFERTLKKITQKTNAGKTFTDSQYAVRKKLEEYDFFSFSGPTSIGKTFIIGDFIEHLVEESVASDDCVVVLVPTRALITQVTEDLRKQIKDKDTYIASYSTSSSYLDKKYKKFIYVLTPERLLNHISNSSRRVRHLIVDEAQKIVSIKDSRSSLYYHSIYECIKKYAAKLLFTSPNIPNPELFLRVFERNIDGHLVINDQAVAQNRFYIDLIDNQALMFSVKVNKSPIRIPMTNLPQETNELMLHIASGSNSIVYCNGIGETVQRAVDLASHLDEDIDDKSLEALIKFVKEYVHKDYYLIDCLKKGVAFHHGRMPQKVRRQIEKLYCKKQSPIKFVFCTSTLLEGVNLPAKNMFVLNDNHGTTKFKKIDFENLIGRAGRLTKEFSGNVVCIKDSPKRWKDGYKIVKQGKPQPVDSFLLEEKKGKKKEFNNISKALSGQKMPKSVSQAERENYNHYSSILLLHHSEKEGSPLKVGFLEKIQNATKVLEAADADNNVPNDILRVSSTIRPKYQNLALSYIANNGSKVALPPINKETDFFGILERLYDIYNWGEEESRGKDALIPGALQRSGHGKSRLYYWAMLLRNWINSSPLNVVIGSAINYHLKREEIWFYEEGRLTKERFTGNQKQINIVIEQVLNDIENGLRFRIEKYLLNYYLLTEFQLGKQKAGVNWAERVEYGSSDKRSIELQNLGLSRPAALHLLKEHIDSLVFSSSQELLEIDERRLKSELGKDNEDHAEIKEILKL